MHQALHKNTDRTTKNCGRKRKTTKHGDRLLKLLNQRSPEASSTSIAQQIRQLGVNISSHEVRRRLLSDFELLAYRPAKKILIIESQRRMRLKFCNLYKDKPADWWDSIMFSDGKCVSTIA